jgi:hypothetical protein
MAEIKTRGMVQVIVCKCGATFAACTEPECYTEAHWKRDVTKYVKKGCTIKMIPAEENQWGECTCPKSKQKVEQPMLF